MSRGTEFIKTVWKKIILEGFGRSIKDVSYVVHIS